MLDVLQTFIASYGYQIDDDLELEDRWINCKCAKTGEKLRYVGKYNAAGKLLFTFGSFSRGDLTWTFREKGAGLTKEERIQAKKEQLEKWEIAKLTAKNKLKERSWGDRPLTDTYLSRKWPLPTVPLKSEDYTWLEDINYEAMLCVAMRDAHQEIWNVQFIQKDGTKRHLGVARTQGLFLEIPGDEKPRTEIYLCEGLATSLSVREATGARTLCCFSSGNIKHVLSELKKAKWKANFIVVCDNDWEKKTNAGALAKEQLLKKFSGIEIIMPSQYLLNTAMSDYNDVHTRNSLEAVKRDIENQLPFLPTEKLSEEQLNLVQDSPDMITPEAAAPTQAPTAIGLVKNYIQKYQNGVLTMPPKLNDKGKEIIPEDGEVANHILEYYGHRIIRVQNSFFIYKGTHWVEVKEAERADLNVQAMVALNGKGGVKKFKAVRECLFDLVPRAPVDLFVRNPYVINFKNGTLHVVPDSSKWKFDFRKHSPNDFCVNTIPIDYDETRAVRNKGFEDMVLRCLGNDADKVRSLKQMYGACLAPIWPRLFMLLGPKGSGKSSLIIAANRLIHESNVGHVQPSDMIHPHLESLIGKMVNAVTDIDVTKPIQDSVVKMIEDQTPISINRKYEKVINAPLPAVHMFGGNEMPPTFDRGSRAHTRRWTFIVADSFRAEEGSYTRDFANKVVDLCPQGVLNFALEGLQDLCDSDGLYFSSEASKTAINAWQDKHDVVASFVAAAKDDEAHGLIWSEHEFMKRSELWRKFREWHKDEYSRDPKIPKNRLFEALQKVGAKSWKHIGEMHVLHFCLKSESKNTKRGKSKVGAKEIAPGGNVGAIDQMI